MQLSGSTTAKLADSWAKTCDFLHEYNRGQLIVLDGGTGTRVQQIEPRAADQKGWSSCQVSAWPKIVEQVHCEYCEAGAQCIIANTYATSRHVLAPTGMSGRTAEINQAAIELARSAIGETASRGGRTPLLAASVSCHPPEITPGTDAGGGNWPDADTLQRSFDEQAQLLLENGAQALFLEMLFDRTLGLMAFNAAKKTGLPIFVCIACFPDILAAKLGIEPDKVAAKRGAGADINTAFMFDGKKVIGIEEGVKAFLDEPNVAGFLIHHTKSHYVLPCLQAVRRAGWRGPLGAYPDQGTFKMPEWIFEDMMSVREFLDFAKLWVEEADCRMIGGCCGFGPEYIQALRDWKASGAVPVPGPATLQKQERGSRL